MREPTWALNMLAEVLSAFSVDDPNGMVDVVFRVAENLDAEAAAIVRGNRVTQSVGILPRDEVSLLEAVVEQRDWLTIRAGRLHLSRSSLGRDDYFVVGRLATPFDLEERSLLRAMARSIELSSQVVAAMEAERLATRLQEELAVADEIQRRMLWDAAEINAQTPEFDVAALMLTSKEVGGDLYDWIPIGGHSYCFCIGDVAGKGVPAAMLMSTCLSLLRAYVEVYDSPSAIIRRINHRLCHNNNGCTFTTMLLGVVDARTGEIRYCNAGHNPALMRREDGRVEKLNEVHGPALGILDGATYGESRAVLRAGDRLLAYTDGANETFNRRHQRYGVRRLIDFAASHAVVGSQKFLEALVGDLVAYSDGELIHDDTTLLTFRFSSREEEPAPGDVLSRDLVIEVANDISRIGEVAARVKAFCANHCVPVSAYRKLMIVIDDLLNNTIRYGCVHLGERAVIRLGLSLVSGGIMVNLVDNGLPFNPLEMAAPNVSSGAEERAVGGLGIYMMRNLTRASRYHRQDGFNSLTLELQVAAT